MYDEYINHVKTFQAPVVRGWYLTLERVVTPLRVPNAVAATFAKVSLDQLVFAPLFNVVLISIIGLSQVTSMKNIIPSFFGLTGLN